MNAAPADYSNRDFRGEDMRGVDLRGANLSGANLVGSHGLAARKLLGADLTGARLPENIKKFEALKGVDNATKGAGRVWTTTMLACLYCWLTIATTTDAAFFGAEQQTALPFIQTKMSMPAFYLASPVILFVVFLYLQFSLQTLWEAYASLPAVFPDGRPLHERAAPFFLSSIVRNQFDLLRNEAPGLARWQALLAWILGWWVVPFTLGLLWARSLVARLPLVTAVQVAAIAGSIGASLFFGRIARDTLRGVSPQSLRGLRDWITRSRSRVALAIALGAGASFGACSVVAYFAVPPQFARYRHASALQTIVPHLMRKVSLSPFANLAHGNLSPSREQTGELGRERIDFPGGAQLQFRSFRYCDAEGATLADADLTASDLTGGIFDFADLHKARLTGALLQYTSLGHANLTGANLSGTDLSQTFFDSANLQGADVYGTSGFSFLRSTSRNWVLAYWDDAAIQSLHLPAEHNQRLDQKDLSGYDFAKLSAEHMQGAQFQGWDLRNTNFSGVELDDANLSKSDLRGAVFAQTRLTNVNFEGADLRGANLRDSGGLTQWQVKSAITDDTTQLPAGLLAASSKLQSAKRKTSGLATSR